MRTFLIFLLSVGIASGATVTGSLGGSTASNVGNVRLNFTPRSTPYVGTNGTLYLTVPAQTIAMSGSFAIDLVPGLYDVTSSTGDRFSILVPEDPAATADLSTIITNLTSFAITNYVIPVPYSLIEAGLTNALSPAYFKMSPGLVKFADDVSGLTNSMEINALVVDTTVHIGTTVGFDYYGNSLYLYADSDGALQSGSISNASTGIVVRTNLSAYNYFIPTNDLASWPAAPRTVGEVFVGNSNGWIYMLNGGLSGAWSKTNLIAEP